MVMPSSASFLFYVGPLNQFSSFPYVLHVHMQGKASFNVLYVNDVVWSLRNVECSIRLSSAPRGKPRGLCANLRPLPRPPR